MPQDRNDYVDPSPSTPGKTQVAYPSTSNVDDLLVTEDIQIRPEDYEPLPYGTPHPKNDSTGLELFLVWQGPVKGSDAAKAVRRVYATPRTAQDATNYAIKYDSESNAHPIYIRRYVLPRENYAPLDKGSTLGAPLNGPVLVKEELQPLDDSDPQLASLFVRVIRVYQTLPGPVLTTKSLGQQNLIPEKYRRLVRTVETNQTVPADYTFPEGLTGNQSFVELAQQTIAEARLKIIEEVINTDESALVGGQTGEFGNLVINEEIVDEGTPPLFGELIQDSKVTALGNGKAIRITVKYPDDFDLHAQRKYRKTIGQKNLIPEKYRRLIRTVETEQPVPVDYTFPTGLTGDQTFIEFAQKTITEARLTITEEVINTDESPLLGGETDQYGQLIILEEIVDEGTSPLIGFLYKKSTVTALGNGKAIRITLKYPENLAAIVLKDQEHDRRLNVVIPKNRRIAPMGSEIGTAGKEIRALDTQRAEITEADITALEAVLTDYFVPIPAVSNLQLPDRLMGVGYLVETSAGDGSSTDQGIAQTVPLGGGVVDFAVRFSASASSEAAAAAMPELVPDVRETWARNVKTKRCTFFLKRPFVYADVLTKLTAKLGVTVLDWPAFRPAEHMLYAIGKKMRVQAHVSAAYNYSFSSTTRQVGQSKGKGSSRDVSISSKEIHIRPTIHGAISFNLVGGNGGLQTVRATAEANAQILGIESAANVQIVPATGEYAIYPASLDATEGDSAIPASGVRLLDLHHQMYEYDWIMLEAEVVDFADIPINSTGGGPVYTNPNLPIIRYDGIIAASNGATLEATINP